MKVSKKEILLETLLENLTDEKTKNLQTRCIELIQDADWLAFNFKDIVADQIFCKAEGWDFVTVNDLENRLGIIKPKYRYIYEVYFYFDGWMYSSIKIEANNKEQVEQSDEYLRQKRKYNDVDIIVYREKTRGSL